MGSSPPCLNLNARAAKLADELADDATAFGVSVHDVAGARVIDAGHKQPGSLGAGMLAARICLADLATVQIGPAALSRIDCPSVNVSVNQPLAACMASQYAGWQIQTEDYFAMGSGPFRAAGSKEKLFDEIGHRETPDHVVGVLEGKLPSEAAVNLIAEKCNVAPTGVTLIVARTASIVGSCQVVARSVETAMHKLHELHFDLSRITAGFGSAPLAPVAKDDMAAIGRTNDAVLYGGNVTLYVTGDDDSLTAVGEKLPSSASNDYGKPFGVVFKEYEYDFYKIDPMLFSPAKITFQNIDTGVVQSFGKLNEDVLIDSFFANASI